MKPTSLGVTCRVADYLMARVAALGVEQVFFLPGGGAMHLNDALAQQAALEAIVCHHEQACGIAAEACGRTSTAGFGVAMVTTGPGATNILTPVAGAWIESLPLLVIAGQVKRADALNGRPLRQGGVQEVDVVSIVKPITKFAVTVKDPLDIRRCFEQAVWNMREGRAGPVWLDVPLDVQAAHIDPDTLEGFNPTEFVSVDMTSAYERVTALLASAQRPLLLAGHGVRLAGAAEAFLQLAESLQIPCVFTWNASDLMPWDHPLHVGRPGVVAARAPNFAVQNCDCILSIGCRLDPIVTAYNPAGFARGAKKIVVDIDANELERQPEDGTYTVKSDARDFIEGFLETQPAAGQWSQWRERCTDWKRRYTPLDGHAIAQEGASSHYQFVNAVSDAIPEDHLIVTGSSGLAVEVFYTAFRNKRGQRFFLTSGLGSMGYGLAAAIGACLGAGRRPTVCIESDGSLMLNLQELATLSALQLPIVILVMNNGGYASIRNTQNNYFAGRELGSGEKSGLWIPDYVSIGQSFGLSTSRIDDCQELAAGLADALARPGPHICDVRLQTSEILAPKVAAIPQRDGSMISMPLEDMSPLLPLVQLEAEMLVPLDQRSYSARSS